MGARQVGTEEVTGGELRGGRWFGSKVGFGLWWSLVEAEAHGETGGGVGWTGEGLVAMNGTGRWRRPNRPESRKTATICRLLAERVLWGGLGSPECSEELGGLLL